MIPQHDAISFALYQCEFGAATSKPTRFVTNLGSLVRAPPPFTGLPWFDERGRYSGPLPRSCPHGGHEDALIGKDPATRQWRTAPTASYPAGLCRFLAQHVVDSLLSAGGAASSSTTAVPHLGPSPKVPESRPAGSSLGFSPQGPSASNPVLPPPSAMPELKQSGSSVGFSPQEPQASRSVPLSTGSSVGFSPQGSRASRPVPQQPKPKPACSSVGFSSQRSQASVPALQTPKADDSGTVGQQVEQAPTLWPFPGEGAEEFATRLLGKTRAVLRDEIVALFRLLPKEDPLRGSHDDDGATSFSTGAYCKGGLVGLRANFKRNPVASEVLASFMCLFHLVAVPGREDAHAQRLEECSIHQLGFSFDQVRRRGHLGGRWIGNHP